jgi:hypothetical protein
MRFRGAAVVVLQFVGNVDTAGREHRGQASSGGGLLVPLLSQPPSHHVFDLHRDIRGFDS